MVQWLGICASSAGGPGSIPGLGAISHLPWLRVCMLRPRILMLKVGVRVPQLKIPHAAMKIEDPVCSSWDWAQPNK